MADTVQTKGIEGFRLGENPLTLWLVSSAVIVFLYIRRSHIGVDLHPAEKQASEHKVTKIVKPTIRIPVLPPAGVDWSKAK